MTNPKAFDVYRLPGGNILCDTGTGLGFLEHDALGVPGRRYGGTEGAVKLVPESDADWEQMYLNAVEREADARMWARHGYEIGQRSGTWSDEGVAPKWLTEGHSPEALASPSRSQRMRFAAEILEETSDYFGERVDNYWNPGDLQRRADLLEEREQENAERYFGAEVVSCPDCGHGIDPHGADPGGPCGVGDEHGIACPCLMQPNGIAYILFVADRATSAYRASEEG